MQLSEHGEGLEQEVGQDSNPDILAVRPFSGDTWSGDGSTMTADTSAPYSSPFQGHAGSSASSHVPHPGRCATASRCSCGLADGPSSGSRSVGKRPPRSRFPGNTLGMVPAPPVFPPSLLPKVGLE